MPSSPPIEPSALERFKTTKEYFVGIDSDGCVFNSMEVKHKDCFSVAFVRAFDLAEISRQAHEVWEFVNLYSQTRGCNRFMALTLACDFLRRRPCVQSTTTQVPDLVHLKAWSASEPKLGNKTLARAVKLADGERKRQLAQVLAWSLLVNDLVGTTATHLPPFPRVTDCLARFATLADTIVVSSTPVEVLEREWAQYELGQFVALIAGQEMGAKSELLRATAAGRYEKDSILMIGDAPGDLRAAASIGALFFPIVPGDEERSWRSLQAEASDRFFDGTYRGSYADALITDFMRRLPTTPKWETA